MIHHYHHCSLGGINLDNKSDESKSRLWDESRRVSWSAEIGFQPCASVQAHGNSGKA